MASLSKKFLLGRFLPEGITVYDLEDTIIFNIYGTTGYLYTQVLYLIFSKDGFHYVYAIEFGKDISESALMDLIFNCAWRFRGLINDGKARTFDINGGDLGRGDNLGSRQS